MSTDKETPQYPDCSLKVLGKYIGTYGGWDSDGDQSYIFYDFEPNDLGKSFLQDGRYSQEYKTITIDFETGEVITGEMGEEEANSIKRIVDWSIFN